MTSARFVSPPAFASVVPRKRGARGQGLRYEAKARAILEHSFRGFFVAQPWVEFTNGDSRPRLCQPDGLLFNFHRGTIVIVEMKLKHTSDAYFQLTQLYLPVVKKMFPKEGWKIALCEVVRWYDPSTVFPVVVRMRQHVEDCDPGCIGLHILKA